MASYTVVTSTAVNVAGATTNITSTKVKVVANNSCVYAINAPATLTSNVGPLIPQNIPVYINMNGLNNKLSILPAAGLSTIITVTEIGTVSNSGVTGSTYRPT